MRLVIPLALIAAAWVLLFAQVEPVPTWFYVFAWYPTLVLLDESAHRIDGRPHLLRGWRRIASLFGWSAVIWLAFEAANFRLGNWYYVFLPKHPVERWAGILISFATVVPALVLLARLLDALRGARRLRSAPLPLPLGREWIPAGLGVLTGGLALTWPQTFFPLIWGAWWLLLEPFVYRRRPDLSLFADLTRGEWQRTTRLLVAGFLVGVLWELYNFRARGKWVYTVPWLEDFKLFEMPPVGFLGFPFFALEAWAMYAALVAVGAAVAVDVREGDQRRREATQGDVGGVSPSPFIALHRPSAPFWSLLVALVFAALALLGMERWTISSVAPSLTDLPGVERYVMDLRNAGVKTPFELAATPVESLAAHPGIPALRAAMLTETAKLVILRGLGVEHAQRLRTLDIYTQCTLAVQDPATLWSRYHDRPVTFDPPTVTPPRRPTPAEVRVWVAAARSECVREQRE